MPEITHQNRRFGTNSTIPESAKLCKDDLLTITKLTHNGDTDMLSAIVPKHPEEFRLAWVTLASITYLRNRWGLLRLSRVSDSDVNCVVDIVAKLVNEDKLDPKYITIYDVALKLAKVWTPRVAWDWWGPSNTPYDDTAWRWAMEKYSN